MYPFVTQDKIQLALMYNECKDNVLNPIKTTNSQCKDLSMHSKYSNVYTKRATKRDF